MDANTTTWIVTDGASGNQNQCLALTHYLQLEPEVFTITLRQPWESAAPWLQRGGRRAIQGPLAGRMSGPLPDLLLTAGRRSTLAATTIKRLSGGHTFTVQLLDPRIDPAHFDLVVCPRHDQLAGPNVLTMQGAAHRIDDATLARAREQWRESLEAMPAPRVAVLIGASNRAFVINESHVETLARTAERIAGNTGSLLVTTSRRTPESLRDFVRRRFQGRIWTGPGDGQSPYPGFLAWSDHILVTADSINMISEALGTGKPVYCTPPGKGTARFRRFLHALWDAGLLLPLERAPAQVDYAPLRETAQIAEAIGQRYRQHRQTTQ